MTVVKWTWLQIVIDFQSEKWVSSFVRGDLGPIFEIFSPKQVAKKMALLAQNKAKLC
jgi:hypothetical protein